MIRFGFVLALLVGVTFALAAPAMAGAWTLRPGEGLALVTGTASRANRGFDGDWRSGAAARTDKFELQAWLEYGLGERFTAIVSTGLQHLAIAAPVDASRTGLGYSEFGGRFGLFENATSVVSVQATMRMPGTFDDSNPAAIGYANTEYDLRALFGTSFSIAGRSAFIDLQVAQRARAGDPPDEFRADLTFGLRLQPRWLLLAQSFNVISQGGSAPSFPAYEYHKLQLSAVYDVAPNWALQFGAFTTYAGRNSLQENGAVFSVWYRF